MPVNAFGDAPRLGFDFINKGLGRNSETTTKTTKGNVTTTTTEKKSPEFHEDKGYRTIKIKNGVIDGIKTGDGWFTSDEALYATNQLNMKGVKRYQKQIDISGGKTPGGGKKKATMADQFLNKQ